MTQEAAWHALDSALQDVAAPCVGRALFTADSMSPAEQALCARVCAACPLTDLCDAYATAARVDFGFWGGRCRGRKRKK